MFVRTGKAYVQSPGQVAHTGMEGGDIEQVHTAELEVFTSSSKRLTLVIREKPVFAKPESFKNAVEPGEFVTVNKLVRLGKGRVMGRLESRNGFIPVLDPTRPEDEQVMARRMPMERGLWRYKVNNEGSSLALRKDPSYSPDSKVSPEILFKDGDQFTATHRVVGWKGSVYVRPLGYNGWLFETREGSDTLISLPSMSEGSVAIPRVTSPPQLQPGHRPLSIEIIHYVANLYDLRKVQHTEESRVISFVTPNWPKEDSKRYNIFYTTGTVGIVVTHKDGSVPRRTQTFIRNIASDHELELIISGLLKVGNEYSTRKEMFQATLESLISPGCRGSVTDPGHFDYVALAWSREVRAKLEHQREIQRKKEEAERERKRKAEEAERERKRKAEEAERERKKIKLAKERDERGLYEKSWMVASARSGFDSRMSSDVKRVFFSDDNDSVVCLKADGTVKWTCLPRQTRLDSLLRGSRGRGDKSWVDILALVRKPCDHIAYYIQFKDGSSYWEGLDDQASKTLKDNTVLDVSLGCTESGDVTYIIRTTKSTHWTVNLGIHKSWFKFDGLKRFSLGPEGQYFIQRSDGQVLVSQLQKDQYKALMKFKNSGDLRGVTFGWDSALIIRYS